MNKKYFYSILTAFSLLLTFIIARPLKSETNLSQKLAGRILLQVEDRGMAWYVNPSDYKRYYLGKPDDAFNVIKNLGIGIKNQDLKKIPIGLLDNSTAMDTDGDGLSEDLEKAIGTDFNKPDTNGNGYNDKTEIENGYDPTQNKKMAFDYSFINTHLGKIFLQVEDKGQAWYIDPKNKKRYFLNKPMDAFTIMRKLSLGINNSDLSQISLGYLNIISASTNQSNPSSNVPAATSSQPDDQEILDDEGSKVMSGAAMAIKNGQVSQAVSYFTPAMKKSVEYTINYLNSDGRLALSNILLNTKLTSSTATQKIFSSRINFSLGGYNLGSQITNVGDEYNVDAKFIVEKQSDGKWLLTNL